jgi:hypothetical protein
MQTLIHGPWIWIERLQHIALTFMEKNAHTVKQNFHNGPSFILQMYQFDSESPRRPDLVVASTTWDHLMVGHTLICDVKWTADQHPTPSPLLEF